MKNLKKLILVIFMININITKTEHIFFDMGGVLLQQSNFRAFFRLGLNVLGHLDLRKRFFEFLHHIDSHKHYNSPATFQGDKMPGFMCRWQEGLISSDELCKYVIEQVDQNPQFFKNKTEQKLIKKCGLMLIGTNHVFATQQKRSMIKLLKQCKVQKDKNGNYKNTIYLTSNCDVQTFNAYKQKFPHIFALFDEDKIILSGKINIIKPEKKFFQHVIQKFNLNPQQCILIDDQIENIKAFNELVGLEKGILYNKTSKTKSKLKELGVIK